MTRLIQIVVAAVPVGSVYALAASGLVLTYRTSRVFNFAHGAVGMFSAFLFYQAWQVWRLPLPLAFCLVVLVFATAAVAGILLTPTLGLDSFTLTMFVIQAFAAALFGRLESFPLAFLGGMVIALCEQVATTFLPSSGVYLAVRPAVPFALIFGILAYAALVPGSRMGRWVRTGPGEPSAPRPSTTAGTTRRARLWGLGLAGVLAAVAPMLGSEWLSNAERGLAFAGVFASLVLLSGLSGQISLA